MRRMGLLRSGDVAVQFSLAGAVAADCVDTHTSADHVVGQNRGVLFVGGAGRDDLGPLNRLLRGIAGDHLKPLRRQVARGLGCRGRVYVEEMNPLDSANGFESKALEF